MFEFSVSKDMKKKITMMKGEFQRERERERERDS
jgi:hypothetical protein